MKKTIMALCSLIFLASCATSNELKPKENMTSAYNNDSQTEINIKTNIPQESVSQVPVIEPPVIQPMWIPPHTTQDKRVFITGHWIFVQINNPTWYINSTKNPINLGLEVEKTQ
ncbi:hypothetical protein DESAMIL20_307 [Desulfurella amilsii]|uniref:Lipoprotein n=1 Tax=Desulfurella amilsii TaxID=1562698 RepID=A0A1X4XZA7_9BACT|nr:hypothetical protein [Desulfurella amilsii]OSS42877.1 hypothetical protein DESAMIL20_307 [Desulfurella amilsii]